MTRKRRRLIVLVLALAALAGATGLVLVAFQDNLVFFFAPSELAEKHVEPGQRVRIGGLVEPGTVKRGGGVLEFAITDGKASVPVVYRGAVPDLFREGQGVVTTGRLEPDGRFAASELLAKHDERYMPPEVVEALKRAGRWQEGEVKGP